jgi:hypothetical protein
MAACDIADRTVSFQAPGRDYILNIDGELSGSTQFKVKMRQGAFELFGQPVK